VGSAGHVVHSGARNVDAQFFHARWARCGYHKKHVGDTVGGDKMLITNEFHEFY
jgi:hypothetical protein